MIAINSVHKLIFNRNSASPQQTHQPNNSQQTTPQYHSNNNNNNNGQRKSNNRGHQKSPNSALQSSTKVSAISSGMGSASPVKYMAQMKNGNGYNVGRTSPMNTANRSPSIPIMNNSNRTSPGGQSNMSPSCFASPAGVASSPPNLHFASSKYFDAPSPNSLPRPPMHWTSTSQANGSIKTLVNIGSKRCLFNNDATPLTAAGKAYTAKASHNKDIIHAGGCNSNAGSDIFSRNLKLILNVQA